MSTTDDPKGRAGMTESVIWKFPVHDYSALHVLPRGAQVLSAGVQGDEIVVWILCDPSAPSVPRLLGTCRTGGALPVDLDLFIGTVRMDNGLVFHVFDGGEPS